ncbi:MAG: EAL domain-containing protein [Armatimonadota bacterium]
MRRKLTCFEQTTPEPPETERFLCRIVECLPVAALTMDTQGRVTIWNKAMERLTGVSASDILGKDGHECATALYGERQPILANTVLSNSALKGAHYTRFTREGDILSAESFAPRLGNQGRHLSHKAAPIYDINGSITGAIEIIFDITESKVCQQKLQYLAFNDLLTSLPNRVQFSDRLNREIVRAKKENRLLAVMFLDIDRLKVINDSLGHSVGDKLIKAVAKRLSESLGKTGFLARMGGDEFTVLLNDISSVEQAAARANKLLESLAKPLMVDEKEFYVTTSLGISIFPDHGQDVETLVRSADTAMYKAKDTGRNTYSFYTPELHNKISEKMSLEHDLRLALQRNELTLHFQPRVDISNGSIAAVEALVRWHHPDLGLLSPSQFISVAEDTGLIIPLTKWVLHASCQQIAQWKKKLTRPPHVSVNISASDLHKSDLIETVSQALHVTGTNPSYLELELTETALIQSAEQAATVLGALKELGVSIVIDDFGTGYSSLNNLKKLPIDVVKIDISFIRDITTNADDAALCGAIIAMAHSLKLRVVAEGVETLEQLQFLEDLGCDEIQGYLVAHPVPAEELIDMLHRDSMFRKAIVQQVVA